MKYKWRPYSGSLYRHLMTYEARCAYESYHSQRGKCNNPNNKFYKNYGLKGIKVHYTAREFIGWWLYNLKKFKGSTPTVSRIDHNKGYYFENIKLEDVSENSRESAIRNNLGKYGLINSKKVIQIFNNGKIRKFNSIREAARENGVSQRLIQFYVRGEYKNSRKLKSTFKYEDQ